MADVVDKATRSRMMSGIRGKDTRPEMLIRKHLHAMGFRYRLHDAKLPGKPDIVLPRYKAVILVHGCFWHGHDCHLFKWPSSNEPFWRDKITRNRAVDERTIYDLREVGWRVLIIWECAIKGKFRKPIEQVTECVVAWLNSSDDVFEIRERLTK
jgi:DNA mismatch endonuclease (patch repair protein)